MITPGRILHMLMHKDSNRQLRTMMHGNVMKHTEMDMYNISLIFSDGLLQKSKLVCIGQVLL